MSGGFKAALAVVLVAGAVPFAIGAAIVAKRLAYSSGVAAEAKVVAAERLWLWELVYPVPRRQLYRLSYEFRSPAGPVARGEATYVQSRALTPPAVGDTVRVLYARDHPGSSYLTDSYTVFDAILAAGLGIAIWAGGAWYGWKRREKPATAPRQGS